MHRKKTKAIIQFSNLGFFIASLMLYLIALAIIISAIWSIFKDLSSLSFTVYNLLDEVGLIVFSIAVIDVAKYLMLEEVMRSEETVRHPTEIRRAITKFVIIIATALSLEGLVLTIEVSKSDITKIFYPVLVLFTGIIFIVGIGIYQKLSSSAEEK